MTHDLRGTSVLIIDDDETLRALLRAWLQGMGATVREAADGLEGVQEVRWSEPDVILCDIQMPGLDGREFVKHLRMDLGLAHIPVIAITAAVSESALMGNFEVGFSGYMLKPVARDAVAAQILRVLKR